MLNKKRLIIILPRDCFFSWRPFKYFTVENIRGLICITITSQLEPTETGINLNWFARLNGKLPGWFLGSLGKLIITKILDVDNSWKIMADLLKENNSSLDEISMEKT
jgi:hypothetical protein